MDAQKLAAVATNNVSEVARRYGHVLTASALERIEKSTREGRRG